MGNGNSPLPMMLLSVKDQGGYHQMDIMGKALDIPRQALVKLGTQEAELCVQEVDEIIGSICKVAIRFSNIAHDLLPGQIQAETLQLVQNRIEQIFIYCTK